MMSISKPVILICASGLALVACRDAYQAPSDFERAFNSCLGDTTSSGVSGSYVISPTEREANGHPSVKAGPGGNRRGEILMNGCIAQRVSTAGTPPQPTQSRPPADGKLPLPTEYTLQPGDAELWPTLSRTQQERALTFLRAGSTVQSSLAPEI